jgi:hypothetical protein
MSDAACLDFDFSVRALKRWADRRSDETELVADHSPERKQRMKSVPRYPSLMDVLGLKESGTESPTERKDVDDLVAQMMTGPQQWQPQDWPTG